MMSTHQRPHPAIHSWLLGSKTPAEFYPQSPPGAVGLDRLVTALGQAEFAWPTFEVRMLLRGNAEDNPESIFYLHLEGSFSSSVEPLATRLADPEVIAGRLDASTTYEYVRSWAGGEPVFVGGRAFRLPVDQLGALLPEHTSLQDQTYLRLLGENYPAATGLPIITGWVITASSLTASMEDTAVHNQFNLIGHQSGSSPTEFAMHHLGRDYSRFNSPGVTVVLPLPLVFNTAAEAENIRVELHVRHPLAQLQYWTAAAAGPWDLLRERYRDWTIDPPDESGWVRGRLLVPDAAIPPVVTVWLGREDHPEVSTKVHVPPGGALVQRAAALQLLVGTVPLADSLQPAANAKGNVAQNFEVAVANVLGSLGFACVNVGVPVHREGLDILAFHNARQECWLVSVTTSGDISRKLSGLLRRRADVVPALPAWACKLVVVTSVERGDLAPADLRDFEAKYVGVITGTELHYATTDVTTVSTLLEQILAGVRPVAI